MERKKRIQRIALLSGLALISLGILGFETQKVMKPRPNVTKSESSSKSVTSLTSNYDYDDVTKTLSSSKDLGVGSAYYAGKADFTVSQKSSKATKGFVNYGDFDSQGRTTAVSGMVTKDLMDQNATKNKARPPFDTSKKTSGWAKGATFTGAYFAGGKDYNPKIKTDNYSGFLYNRSHLFAYSLGGDMNVHNYVKGTRQQNVGWGHGSKNQGGMAYLESKVRDYMKLNSKNRVLYSATPIYKDNERMPRYVVVNAYSLNDNGKTLDEQVITTNDQKGITIENYETGDVPANQTANETKKTPQY